VPLAPALARPLLSPGPMPDGMVMVLVSWWLPLLGAGTLLAAFSACGKVALTAAVLMAIAMSSAGPRGDLDL